MILEGLTEKKNSIGNLEKALSNAESIVIGAGSGLSASAGFTYSGERFERYFSDFRNKYGFSDMYSGGFYPFPTPEEEWAYWSRYIFINRYTDPPKDTYSVLRDIVEDKDLFVITTNVDHCFQKAGFDKKRLFYTQGDYGLWQCSGPCSEETYDNEEAVRRMYTEQKDMRIPSSLIPHCPHCKRVMKMNLRADNSFVEDEGWKAAEKRYENFLKTRKGRRILFLELGVGYNTPGIIKYPFWEMTASNENAVYASINSGEAVCPSLIRDRSVCLIGDIDQILRELRER